MELGCRMILLACTQALSLWMQDDHPCLYTGKDRQGCRMILPTLFLLALCMS